MTPDLGIEPGPCWWEARALTTAPSVLPQLLLRLKFSPDTTVEVGGANRELTKRQRSEDATKQ